MRALRRPVLTLAPVAVLLAALAMFTNIVPFREIVAQNREVAETRAYLETLQEANRRLEDRIGALNTPLEVERLAREQLGFVRPGEESFVVIEPEKPPAVISEDAEAQTAVPETRAWYLRIWDYVTGRDIES